MLSTLVILAPGLLGASVARAARARGVAERIVIWARRPEVRLALAAQSWCDATAESPAEAVREADLVIVAPPVTKIVDLVQTIASHIPPGGIITDVGSVKAEICRLATAACEGTAATFVGSHPMAGSEKTGWAHADPELFVKRTCFVTPLAGTPETATARVVKFWAELDGLPTTVDPDRHDEIVAQISHLPQAIATALAGYLGELPGNARHFAGNGLRDTTRIAASDATMWVDIFQQNRDEVLRALSGFEDNLHRLRSALANRDWTEVRARLQQGRQFRESLLPPV